MNLGHWLFSLTQVTSVIKNLTANKDVSKRVACLTKDVLQKMRKDTSFRSFYDVVLLKSKPIPPWVDWCYQGELRAPGRIEQSWHWRANISCDRTRLLQAYIIWSYWLDDERYWPTVWPTKLWYVCKDGVSLNEDPQFTGQIQRANCSLWKNCKCCWRMVIIFVLTTS